MWHFITHDVNIRTLCVFKVTSEEGYALPLGFDSSPISCPTEVRVKFSALTIKGKSLSRNNNWRLQFFSLGEHFAEIISQHHMLIKTHPKTSASSSRVYKCMTERDRHTDRHLVVFLLKAPNKAVFCCYVYPSEVGDLFETKWLLCCGFL